MGTVQNLAETGREGLPAAPPKRRQTGINQLALAVGALLEAQTPHTSALSQVLPVPTERQALREQWRRRLVKHPRVERPGRREPFARQVLEEAAGNGQTRLLSLAQTELGDRFAVLRRARQRGDRSLPVAWPVAVGAAKIGFAGQQRLLERVRAWFPTGAQVWWWGDRFDPAAELFAWVQRDGWPYRRRRKSNLTVATGGGAATRGQLAPGVSERSRPPVRRFTRGVPTHLGRLHEAGQEAPWSSAMDCLPTRAAGLAYGARWAIEPLWSDFKRRGCQRAETQRRAPERLERLIRLLALAR